jgi:hypothetical protein
VFSGYAPLSVRFCQQVLKPNLKNINEVIDLLPGVYFEEIQKLPQGLRKRSKNNYMRVKKGLEIEIYLFRKFNYI